MKANQNSQQRQGTKTGDKQNQSNKGKGASHNIRKNEDVSLADRADEPVPNPPNPIPNPAPHPDMPPTPSRREYEDPGHEHTHRDPTLMNARQHLSGFMGE